MTALTENDRATAQSANTPAENDWNEQNQQRQAIETLAYALWQQRGCPNDSAETDWLEAEQRLTQRSMTAAQA